MLYSNWNGTSTNIYIDICITQGVLTLKDFKITKKEIIDLILGAELQVDLSTCKPPHEKKKISEILSRKLSYAAIKRNLASVQEIHYIYGFIHKDFHKGTLKFLIMERTIHKCYWEQIHNFYKNGKKGWIWLHPIIEIKRLKKGTYL